MPQPYPDPALNSSVSVLEYANTVTDGAMVPLFSLAAVIIVFTLLKQKGYRTSDSLLIAFAIPLLLSSFLWAIGLMAGKFLVILLLLTVAAGIYSMWDT